MWLIFASVMILVGAILYLTLTNLASVGVLKYYALWGVLLVGFFYWNTKRLQAQNRHLHVHHYVVAMIVLSFLCYQSPFLTACHGFFSGMLVEGGARWGFDAIWEENDSKNEDEKAEGDQEVCIP